MALDARIVLETSFALEIHNQRLCGQAENEAMFDHAFKVASGDAEAFLRAMERAAAKRHEAVDMIEQEKEKC